MKKLLLATLLGLSVTANINAFSLPSEEYKALHNKIEEPQNITQFFSFYCGHCLNYELNYKVPEQIQQRLKEVGSQTEFKQYHVDFMGGLSEELTDAWSVALLKDMGEKVKADIFYGIRDNQIRTKKDILAVFEKHGLNKEEFEKVAQSLQAKALSKRQRDLANELNIGSVPNFIALEKYELNPQAIAKGIRTQDDFFKKYINVLLSITEKTKEQDVK